MASSSKSTEVMDLRAQRREARVEQNRQQILDAAELVAGDRGLAAASVREIAAAAGFSPAALYLFFDNREHVLAEAMTRRGGELIAALERAAGGGGTPLARLHAVVDATVEFFAERPHFGKLLRQVNPGGPLTGPALNAFAADPHAHFTTAMTLLADLMRQGQRKREIRAGNAAALAQLFSVLVNEHVFLSEGTTGSLTTTEFHAFIDSALRR